MSRARLVDNVRNLEAAWREATRNLTKVRHSGELLERTVAAQSETAAYAAYREAVRLLREDAKEVYGVSFAELAAISRAFRDET